MSRASRAAAALALAMLAGLASCAPPRPTPLPELGTVMQRYRAGVSARERLAAGLRADLLVWARVRGATLPGASGRIRLRSPDGCYVVIPSALGVALELAAHADTLEAYVPSRRSGARIVTDPGVSGVRPAVAVVRLLSGTWDPPGAAWDDAVASDSGWVVRWSELGDSLRLLVDRDGRPSVAEWRPLPGDTVRVRYVSFAPLAGGGWPDRAAWSEQRWAMRAIVRFERIRPDAARGREEAPVRLTTRDPAGIREVADLERWWSELTREIP